MTNLCENCAFFAKTPTRNLEEQCTVAIFLLTQHGVTLGKGYCCEWTPPTAYRLPRGSDHVETP